MNLDPITYTQVRYEACRRCGLLEQDCFRLQDANCNIQEEAPKPEPTTTFNIVSMQ